MANSKMQIESIMFDWRLYAERGLPSYLHHHEDGKRVDQCEIQFLNKMLEEKNFANINADDSHHHTTSSKHGLKSNLSKKTHHHHFNNKVVTIDNQATASIQQQQTTSNKCDYCGNQHCDQHTICAQQHKMCEEEQRLNRIKQQQYQQQILINEISSRPSSQLAFCKSTTPDFSSKNDQLNTSLNRSQLYTIQTGNTSFECTGAIRKAGFLSVKKWLLRKRQHVELARKRGWKCYWTVLKGTTLLFYECNFISNLSLDKSGALQLNAANTKLMQQITGGGVGANLEQLRPYSSKSNDTLGDFEGENLYENLAVCSNCVHCSRCNRVINNNNNETIYQNRLEANNNLVVCIECSQQQQQQIPSIINENQSSLIKCTCDCHQNENTLQNKKSHLGIQQIAYQPKHLILIDNSIAQPIPEHPHRQHVFCLSTAIGDAYLFSSSM